MISTVNESQTFEVLFDSVDSTAAGMLPHELREIYGGDLALDVPLVYANMVATIDGITAERTRARSSRDISGGAASDRFVMGVLRACADAVVIGAGTLRAHPAGTWTAEGAYAAASEAFAALRVMHGLAPRPRLVVVSGSGRLRSDTALRGSIVISSERGASRLPDEVVEHAQVEIVADDERGVDVARAIEGLRAKGHTRILTEGGPRLMGSLFEAQAIDELFLTTSPVIAGRTALDRRPGLVDGFEFPAGRFQVAALRSIRHSDSFLFMRYRLTDRSVHTPDVETEDYRDTEI